MDARARPRVDRRAGLRHAWATRDLRDLAQWHRRRRQVRRDAAGGARAGPRRRPGSRVIRSRGPWIALGLVVVVALAVVLWPSGSQSLAARAHDLETEFK